MKCTRRSINRCVFTILKVKANKSETKWNRKKKIVFEKKGTFYKSFKSKYTTNGGHWYIIICIEKLATEATSNTVYRFFPFAADYYWRILYAIHHDGWMKITKYNEPRDSCTLEYKQYFLLVNFAFRHFQCEILPFRIHTYTHTHTHRHTYFQSLTHTI